MDLKATLGRVLRITTVVVTATTTPAMADIFSSSKDQWQIIKDSYGDPQIGIDLTSIHDNTGLKVAIVRGRDGNETYFVTDCTEYIALMRFSDMDDLSIQMNHLDRAFPNQREHVHPQSLGAAMMAVTCKPPAPPD